MSCKRFEMKSLPHCALVRAGETVGGGERLGAMRGRTGGWMRARAGARASGRRNRRRIALSWFKLCQWRGEGPTNGRRGDSENARRRCGSSDREITSAEIEWRELDRNPRESGTDFIREYSREIDGSPSSIRCSFRTRTRTRTTPRGQEI